MIIGLSALVGNPGLRRWRPRHQPMCPINAACGAHVSTLRRNIRWRMGW